MLILLNTQHTVGAPQKIRTSGCQRVDIPKSAGPDEGKTKCKSTVGRPSVCGHAIFMEGIFLCHSEPEPLAVCVEGVSQFGKNPVCGFVVLCGQDLSAVFSDFIFSGHESSQGKPYVSSRNVPVGSIRCILYEKDFH